MWKISRSKKVGCDGDLDISLYEQAVNSTSTAAEETLVQRYRQAQREYLPKFTNDQLYKALTDMDHVFYTFEGAEEYRRPSLKVYVTCV